jgi:predicted amidohydrolase YtcJ
VGLQAIAANLLPPPDGGNDSIAALQATTKAWLASSDVPRRFGVVVGFGYDDSQLKEQRHPTRDELDAISTDLPIYVIHQSGHLGAANSKALELAGITAATVDPQGGVIRRRADSKEPDGVLEETAHYAVLYKVVMARFGGDTALELIQAGQQLYTRFGFTTAQDGATDPANVQAFRRAAAAGRLAIDVVSYPAYVTAVDTPFMKVSKAYDRHFRIAGVKLTLDGSPQGKTAWLTTPYHVVPAGRPKSYAGYATMKDAEVEAAVTRSFREGWQVLAHTNGDAAIDQFLKAVTAASAAVPGTDRRPVAIHAQTARLDQVEAMNAAGIIPAFFPMHTFYWGDWHRDSVLGRERAANISPTGWALQRGMIFTSHHDAPVALPDSMRVLSATVNRTTRSGTVLGEGHRVDPYVALKAMTAWAAFQHFEEESKGTIEAGKLADFVIVSGNPMSVDRAVLARLQVLETIKEGVSVYRAPVTTP